GPRSGSSAPQSPAEITSGRSSPETSDAQRSSRQAPRTPTGAARIRAVPNAGAPRDGRDGSASHRASARASRASPVRMRIAYTDRRSRRRALRGPLLRPALEPGLPAVARRSVLAREQDRRNLGVSQRERPAAVQVEVLDERRRAGGIAIEDVARDLRAVGLD